MSLAEIVPGFLHWSSATDTSFVLITGTDIGIEIFLGSFQEVGQGELFFWFGFQNAGILGLKILLSLSSCFSRRSSL